MHRTALLALAVVSSACASAHARHPEAASGIYELTVRVESDTCSPRRHAGAMGAVGVVSEAGVLNIAAPAGVEEGLARVSLARDQGFHAEVTMEIPGCAGASVRRSWTVIESARDRLEVAFAQIWSGMLGCDVPRDQMPMAPAEDCEASLVLEYELTESCPAACELRMTSGGATCSC
jgi:hypothetical protein